MVGVIFTGVIYCLLPGLCMAVYLFMCVVSIESKRLLRLLVDHNHLGKMTKIRCNGSISSITGSQALLLPRLACCGDFYPVDSERHRSVICPPWSDAALQMLESSLNADADQITHIIFHLNSSLSTHLPLILVFAPFSNLAISPNICLNSAV